MQWVCTYKLRGRQRQDGKMVMNVVTKERKLETRKRLHCSSTHKGQVTSHLLPSWLTIFRLFSHLDSIN